MNPIFHLSFPVRDLDAAIAFYVERLGGVLGRRAAGWADIALFSAQLTLHQRPGDVPDSVPRSRHFGATLGWKEWEALMPRLDEFVEAPHVDYAGTEREQAKTMIADPSGNLVELKAYRNPRAVLGQLAAEA